MPETPPLDAARRAISALALGERPGAIVLAEHAIDQHVTLFDTRAEQLTALDALRRDLFRIGRTRLELAPFLKRVDNYIELLQCQFVSGEVVAA